MYGLNHGGDAGARPWLTTTAMLRRPSPCENECINLNVLDWAAPIICGL